MTENVDPGTPSITALLTQNASLLEQNRYLREQLDLLKRHIFGHRTEKLPVSLGGVAPMDLFGKELPTGDDASATPAKIHVPAHDRVKDSKAGHGRAVLPENLPCEEILLDVSPEEKLCPCCGKERVCIGSDSRDELDIIPPRFVKRRYIRPVYACPARACTECGVAQAEPAACVIDKGIPRAGLVTWIVLAKFMDHLPLYRQESIFGRAGVTIARSTLAQWVGTCGVRLQPLSRP